MPCIDLAELPVLFQGRWFWSVNRRNLVAFHREDYLGGASVPLAEAAWREVERELGPQSRGRVMLVANLRHFGYCFNPIALYFCFDARERPVALLADVTNTPWREKRAYVVPMPGDTVHGHQARKILHVSPFMAMEQQYSWTVRWESQQLFLGIASHESGQRKFDASLRLDWQPATGPVLARALARYPAMTLRVVAGIYWQALRIRLKGMRYVPHPGSISPSPADSKGEAA